MSRGFARVTLDSAGGDQLGGGQDFVSIDGAFVVVLDDPVQSHGDSPHSAATMNQASTFVTFGGKRACLKDHQATCGHATTGSDFAGASE